MSTKTVKLALELILSDDSTSKYLHSISFLDTEVKRNFEFKSSL